MKKISIPKVKKELEKYSVDDTHKEMIINNITLYNDIVADYKNGGTHQAYLLYQLNMQIVKQLESLRKQHEKQDVKDSNEDEFTKFLKNFKNNSDNIEKR